MAMPIYSYSCDRVAEKIVKKLREAGFCVKSQQNIDYEKPFFLINGSNNNHHRTYHHLKKLVNIDGYFHIDHHDDIGLRSLNKVDFSNFVEWILQLNKKVIFIGQNYWKRKIIHNGMNKIMLERNNMDRYKPISNIFFLSEKGQYIFIPILKYDAISCMLLDIKESPNIEEVFVLDELNYKGDINTFSRNDLAYKPIDLEYYPSVIIKWKKCNYTDLNLSNVYVSIDLDVLKKGCISTQWSGPTNYQIDDLYSSITNITENHPVLGMDICGPKYPDEKTIILISKIIRRILKIIS